MSEVSTPAKGKKGDPNDPALSVIQDLASSMKSMKVENLNEDYALLTVGDCSPWQLETLFGERLGSVVNTVVGDTKVPIACTSLNMKISNVDMFKTVSDETLSGDITKKVAPSIVWKNAQTGAVIVGGINEMIAKTTAADPRIKFVFVNEVTGAGKVTIANKSLAGAVGKLVHCCSFNKEAKRFVYIGAYTLLKNELVEFVISGAHVKIPVSYFGTA